eukprot:276817-Pyramimonas_sp.AAC.1
MEAGSFSNVVLAQAPRAFFVNKLQQFQNIVGLIPGLVFWHDLGLSERNSYADSRCRSSTIGVLA